MLIFADAEFMDFWSRLERYIDKYGILAIIIGVIFYYRVEIRDVFIAHRGLVNMLQDKGSEVEEKVQEIATTQTQHGQILERHTEALSQIHVAITAK